MRYPVVLLDAGGTLIGARVSFGAVYARILKELGFECPAARFEESIHSAVETLERAVPPGRDRFGYFPGGEMAYWFRFARLAMEGAAGKAVDDELVRKAVQRLRGAFRGPDTWEVFRDVHPALRALRRHGVRLAVVSNWDSLLPQLLGTLGLADYFDALAVSHLEGTEKPDPTLFHTVLRKLDALPHEALHVGDSPELDLAGGRAAGIDVVLIDRAGNLDASLGALRDLSRLPDLAL